MVGWVRLFRFYIETVSFGISSKPKQTKEQPKQTKGNRNKQKDQLKQNKD
jgi:hypothetical protein